MSVKSPFLSIVTCCYNAEPFIEGCIRSVLSQEFPDYEYIIIDGGSDDGTVSKIEKYKSSLTYWHSKPDRGIADAFNQGVEHCRGEWILFLNADDYFADQNVLTKMSCFILDNRDADVVFGQIIRVSRDEQPKVLEAPYGQPFEWQRFVMQTTIPHPASFTHKDYFKSEGVFDENYKYGMDYEFFLRKGQALDARYHNVLVSCMRDGGVSRNFEYECYDEWRSAHKKNKHLSRMKITAYYYYHYFRIFIKGLIAP